MLIRLLILCAAVFTVIPILAGQCGLFQGQMPNDLGAPNGVLKAPSMTENSVSSQAARYPEHPMRAYAEIAPIEFSGDAGAAWEKLKKAISTLPRTSIMTDTGSYLYAQQTTLILRFTDDIEFVLDDASQVIHVRSASRIGRKDFGVNRARVETIRAAFNALNELN